MSPIRFVPNTCSPNCCKTDEIKSNEYGGKLQSPHVIYSTCKTVRTLLNIGSVPNDTFFRKLYFERHCTHAIVTEIRIMHQREKCLKLIWFPLKANVASTCCVLDGGRKRLPKKLTCQSLRKMLRISH